KTGGGRPARLPNQAKHLRQRGGGPGDRLLEALPPAAEVFGALGLLRRLERRVAGEAAVGGTGFGVAPAPAHPAPPDHRAVSAGRHHSHGLRSLPILSFSVGTCNVMV